MSNPNLDALHRLSFYKKKDNWKLTRSSEKQEDESLTEETSAMQVDVSDEHNEDKCTKKQCIDLSVTYNIEQVEEEVFLSSGTVDDDISSVGSENTFLSEVRSMPHSSTTSLHHSEMGRESPLSCMFHKHFDPTDCPNFMLFGRGRGKGRGYYGA